MNLIKMMLRELTQKEQEIEHLRKEVHGSKHRKQRKLTESEQKYKTAKRKKRKSQKLARRRNRK